MSDFTIRMVEPNDLTACHTIESRCFPPSEAAWTTSLHNRIVNYPEGFLVAEMHGQIVGQVNSGSTSKNDISDEEFKQLIGHDPDGENIVIFSLSVMPEYQRGGIGTLLLNDFIKQARKLEKKNIMLLCKKDMVEYYTRHGFQNGGLSASSHGGAQWNVMVLPL